MEARTQHCLSVTLTKPLCYLLTVRKRGPVVEGWHLGLVCGPRSIVPMRGHELQERGRVRAPGGRSGQTPGPRGRGHCLTGTPVPHTPPSLSQGNRLEREATDQASPADAERSASLGQQGLSPTATLRQAPQVQGCALCQECPMSASHKAWLIHSRDPYLGNS